MTLYEKIDSLCRLYGITITSLSKSISVSRSTFSELKSGRTKTLSTNKLNLIAEYFNTTVNELLDDNMDGKDIQQESINKDIFPEQLRNLRKIHKYTIDELAELYTQKFNESIDSDILEQYEKGLELPTIEFIRKISNIFGVSLESITTADDIDPFLGRLLKQERQEHNDTQKDLAKLLNATHEEITDWENGYGMIFKQQISEFEKRYRITPYYKDYYVEVNEIVGNVLKKIRTTHGYKIEKIAEWLKCSTDKVGKLEQGNYIIPKFMWESICDIYGISYDFLNIHPESDIDQIANINNTLTDIANVCNNLNESGQQKILAYARDIANSRAYMK